ncbi:unnamed protein product, partial [Ectocarpus sp. 8 AP-2014]
MPPPKWKNGMELRHKRGRECLPLASTVLSINIGRRLRLFPPTYVWRSTESMNLTGHIWHCSPSIHIPNRNMVCNALKAGQNRCTLSLLHGGPVCNTPLQQSDVRRAEYLGDLPYDADKVCPTAAFCNTGHLYL